MRYCTDFVHLLDVLYPVRTHLDLDSRRPYEQLVKEYEELKAFVHTYVQPTLGTSSASVVTELEQRVTHACRTAGELYEKCMLFHNARQFADSITGGKLAGRPDILTLCDTLPTPINFAEYWSALKHLTETLANFLQGRRLTRTHEAGRRPAAVAPPEPVTDATHASSLCCDDVQIQKSGSR